MTIELKGMTWDHPRGYAPLIACSDAYAAQHDVRVTWEKRSLKDFGDQPIDELTANYDVLVIDHPHAGLAATTRCVLPLDEWLPAATLQTLADQSAGASHISYQYEGHQWALALDAAMQTAVYRADLLDSPPPSTWDEVRALAQTGRVAMPFVPTDAICSFITLCASLGEPLTGGGDLVSAGTGVAALELLQELGHAHNGSLSWNPIHLLDHMSANDDVAYCPLTFCYTNYSRTDYAPHQLTFTTIPGVRGSILGGTGFAISATSAHPQAAADFGAWLCSADVQRGIYVENQGQPGNIAAWNDPTANQLTGNFFANTLPTLEHSHIRPRHHGFITFQEQAGIIIHAFIRDEGNARDCFDQLARLYKQYTPEAH
jgi:multiple sugar transport system substrate-binding protein